MKQRSLLFLIFILALLSRFYQLGSLPKILNRDEAALGYNAYLLGETGQDEWGNTWPLTLTSFGDYKLIGYPFTLSLLFKVAPLSDWVVRFPSAIAGLLLVGVAYQIARRVEKKSSLSLLFALLIATAPVFIFYSRIAYEANLALLLFVSGGGLLLLPAKKRFLADLVGLVLLMAAVSTYNTPLLLLPFIWPLIPFVRNMKQWKSWILPTAGILIIFIIFFSQLMMLTEQKKGITIFSDETTWQASTQYRESLPASFRTILGHKYVYFSGLIGQRFIKSFSPQFLVMYGGSHPWHAIPQAGHILWPVYIFGLVGISLAVRQLLRTYSFADGVSLYILGVSLIPSVITVDSPHATRSLLFFFMWHWFALHGLKSFIQSLCGQAAKISMLIIIWILISWLLYAYQYFVVYPFNQPQSLKIGLVEHVQTVEAQYPHLPIAWVDSSGFDYILVAWYLKIPAPGFHQTVVKQLPDLIGFRYGEQLTHYHFIGNAADQQVKQEPVLVDWDGYHWSVMTQ